MAVVSVVLSFLLFKKNTTKLLKLKKTKKKILIKSGLKNGS